MIDKGTERQILNKYVGIPYKHKGRNLSGLDCLGLIIMIYADLGREVLDFGVDYDEDWSFNNQNHFIENYHRQWDPTQKAAPGDVVLFQSKVYGKGREPITVVNHGGVVLSRQRFIHSCKPGTVVSELSDAKWMRRLQGFYRLKGGDHDND